MLLADFKADPDNEHKRQGNGRVECNALYKKEDNFNCKLTPSEAMELARHLLQKAQLILDMQLEDAAVHLWNTGKDDERLYVGLDEARKGPRRKKAGPTQS